MSFACTMYRVCAVGGHIRDENDSNGNMFTVPSKKHAEFNRSLHPLAVRTACYFKHYQVAYCAVRRPPTAGGVVPSVMIKGRKRGPAHVDEPHIGNVVVLNAAASICFADSVFAFIGIYRGIH